MQVSGQLHARVVLSQGRKQQCPLNRKLRWSYSRSGRFWRRNNPFPLPEESYFNFIPWVSLGNFWVHSLDQCSIEFCQWNYDVRLTRQYEVPSIPDRVHKVSIQCVCTYHPNASGLWYNLLPPYKNWRIRFFLTFRNFCLLSKNSFRCYGRFGLEYKP
jgi:hypothetical protein